MMNKGFRKDKREEKSEFDQFVLDLARVTRVTQGGKHMSFRALVILGDRRGRVAYGVAKGKDVQLAVEKAVRQAKKTIIRVPLVKETIPHAVFYKFKAATILLKPAPKGSGIIAGGAARVVFELAGIPNISSKILGTTKNKITIVKATFEALKGFKRHTLSAAKSEQKPVAAVEAKTEATEVKPVKKAVVAKKA